MGVVSQKIYERNVINTFGSLIQTALLSVACVTLLFTSFARIVRKNGEAPLTFQIGILCVVAGSTQILANIYARSSIDPWHVTISLCGGALLVLVRDTPNGKSYNQPRLVYLALAAVMMLVYTGISTANKTPIGQAPAYRVDSLEIDPGKVGQVKYQFSICGQKLRAMHTRYAFKITKPNLPDVVVHSGLLEGGQMAPGPTRCGSFPQPIGPISQPGQYDYHFRPIESDRDDFPYNPIVVRFKVTE